MSKALIAALLRGLGAPTGRPAAFHDIEHH